jgi:hypothetical protein
MTRYGLIVELDKDGLVVVQDKDNHSHFAFTFDKIKGYRGETAREIGLREGRQVRFDADGKHVKKAELIAG